MRKQDWYLLGGVGAVLVGSLVMKFNISEQEKLEKSLRQELYQTKTSQKTVSYLEGLLEQGDYRTVINVLDTCGQRGSSLSFQKCEFENLREKAYWALLASAEQDNYEYLDQKVEKGNVYAQFYMAILEKYKLYIEYFLGKDTEYWMKKAASRDFEPALFYFAAEAEKKVRSSIFNVSFSKEIKDLAEKGNEKAKLYMAMKTLFHGLKSNQWNWSELDYDYIKDVCSLAYELNGGNREAQFWCGYQDYHSYMSNYIDDYWKGIRLQNSVENIKESAEQSYPYAQFLLGYFYEKGLGVRQSDEIAGQYYDKAIKAGVKLSKFTDLNDVLEEQVNIEHWGIPPLPYADFRIDWLKKAASKEENVKQKSELAEYYYKNTEYDNAFIIWKELENSKYVSEIGKNRAKYSLALAYENGYGVIIDLSIAKEKYGEVCDSSSGSLKMNACNAYARLNKR